MKRRSTLLEEKLLHYIDGTLAHDERREVEKMLQNDADVDKLYKNLLLVDVHLRIPQVSEPSTNFTAGVMHKLITLPLSNSISIRSSVMLLVGVLLIVSLGVGLVSYGVFDGTLTSIDTTKLIHADRYAPTPNLPSISFDGKLFMKIMIFLNVAVVLIVFDRAVLKPFFQRRMTTK
jgi:hypothetical protein